MHCCAAGKEFDRKLSAPLILSRILDSDDTFIADITKGVKKLPTPTLTQKNDIDTCLNVF